MLQQGKIFFSAALIVCFITSAGMAQTPVEKIKTRGLSAIQNAEPAPETVQSAVPDTGEKNLANSEKSTYIQANEPVRTTSAVASWDFTTGSDKYYGGADGAKDLGDGNWGMIAGDANGNGVVNSADYLSIKSQIFETNYNNADCNLNGYVNSSDYLITKPNIFYSSQVP